MRSAQTIAEGLIPLELLIEFLFDLVRPSTQEESNDAKLTVEQDTHVLQLILDEFAKLEAAKNIKSIQAIGHALANRGILYTQEQWRDKLLSHEVPHIDTVDPKNKDQQITALMYAVKRGHIAWMTQLLAAKANPNFSDKSGKTPLLYVMEEENQQAMTLLLNNKANPNVALAISSTTSEKFKHLHPGDVITPLLFATRNRGDLIKLLLECKADLNFTNKNGGVLHYAMAHKYSSGIHQLLDAKADVNAVNELNETPLIVAAKNGLIELTASFIEQGANLDLKDKNQNTAAELAIKHKKSNCLTLLLEKKATLDFSTRSDSPLVWVIKNNDEETLKVLLQTEIDFITDNQLNFPLHLALTTKSNHLARLLLDAKADPNSGLENKTALILVIKNNNEEGFNLLLERKADINQCSFGELPLHLAIQNDSTFVKPLIEAKAALNSIIRYQTPLMLAVQQNNKAVFDLLLESNCDPDVDNDLGGTALHIAMKNDDDYFGRTLIDVKANVNPVITLSYNETPLMLAAVYNQKSLVSSLLAARANVNTTTLFDSKIELGALEYATYQPDSSDHKVRPGNFSLERVQENTPLIWDLLNYGAKPQKSNSSIKFYTDSTARERNGLEPDDYVDLFGITRLCKALYLNDEEKHLTNALKVEHPMFVPTYRMLGELYEAKIKESDPKTLRYYNDALENYSLAAKQNDFTVFNFIVKMAYKFQSYSAPAISQKSEVKIELVDESKAKPVKEQDSSQPKSRSVLASLKAKFIPKSSKETKDVSESKKSETPAVVISHPAETPNFSSHDVIQQLTSLLALITPQMNLLNLTTDEWDFLATDALGNPKRKFPQSIQVCLWAVSKALAATAYTVKDQLQLLLNIPDLAIHPQLSKLLENLTQHQRDYLLEQLLQLLNSGKNSESKQTDSVKALSLESKSDKKQDELSIDELRKKYMGLNLTGIPKYKRNEHILSLLRLTDKSNTIKLINGFLFENHCCQEKADRDFILENVLKLLEPSHSDFRKKYVGLPIENIPENERDTVTQQAFNLLNSETPEIAANLLKEWLTRSPMTDREKYQEKIRHSYFRLWSKYKGCEKDQKENFQDAITIIGEFLRPVKESGEPKEKQTEKASEIMKLPELLKETEQVISLCCGFS